MYEGWTPCLCTSPYLFPVPWHLSRYFTAIMRVKHNKDGQTKEDHLKQIKLNDVAKGDLS